MVSVHGWKQSGAVLRSHAVGKRDANSSLYEFRTSTPELERPKVLLGFPRHARITRGAELQRIAREGKRIRTAYLEVRVKASPLVRIGKDLPLMHVGLIVPRCKRSAVARNQLKRRLKELIRVHMLPANILLDVVIKTREDAYRASFDQLVADITNVIKRLTQWKEIDMTLQQSSEQTDV